MDWQRRNRTEIRYVIFGEITFSGISSSLIKPSCWATTTKPDMRLQCSGILIGNYRLGDRKPPCVHPFFFSSQQMVMISAISITSAWENWNTNQGWLCYWVIHLKYAANCVCLKLLDFQKSFFEVGQWVHFKTDKNAVKWFVTSQLYNV